MEQDCAMELDRRREKLSAYFRAFRLKFPRYIWRFPRVPWTRPPATLSKASSYTCRACMYPTGPSPLS